MDDRVRRVRLATSTVLFLLLVCGCGSDRNSIPAQEAPEAVQGTPSIGSSPGGDVDLEDLDPCGRDYLGRHITVISRNAALVDGALSELLRSADAPDCWVPDLVDIGVQDWRGIRNAGVLLSWFGLREGDQIRPFEMRTPFRSLERLFRPGMWVTLQVQRGTDEFSVHLAVPPDDSDGATGELAFSADGGYVAFVDGEPVLSATGPTSVAVDAGSHQVQVCSAQGRLSAPTHVSVPAGTRVNVTDLRPTTIDCSALYADHE